MTSGIFLLLFGCFFLEQSTILKKKLWAEIDIHQISFLTLVAVMVFSGIAVRFANDRTFTRTLTSFFLLIFQILAGILFNELTNKAIHHADRSTFSIMSTMTIPLLLLFDLLLGYTVTLWQIWGVILLAFMLIYTFFRGNFSMKGIKYIIASNLISLGTVIAFKYATTHYASTELMNFYNAGGMSLLLFVIICKTKGFKGIKQTFQLKYLWFAGLYGMGGVLTAAAYKFMIASMVIALKRFLAMIFGVITGKLYFHEKHLIKKLSIASLIGIGVLVMHIEPLIAMYLGRSENEMYHASAQLLPSAEKAELMCLAEEWT